MPGKMISSVVTNCKKGWRFDEGSCLFNARGVFSILFSLNLLASLMLIFGKKAGARMMFFMTDSSPFYKYGFLVGFFILLWVVYPKRKILNYDLTMEEQRKFRRYYGYYILFSLAFIIAVGTLR